MSYRDYATIKAPRRHLCPQCLSMAESFQSYTKQERDWELEDRLRNGTATEPEKIKAAWDHIKGSYEWPRWKGPGQYDRMQAFAPLYVSNMVPRLEDVPMEITCQTYTFERHITKTKTHTVTNISCQGITVEETVELA